MAVTRKANLPSHEARSLVLDYSLLNVVTIEPHHVIQAIDFQTKWKISFWDSLILGAARSAGAGVLFSEDFSHGRSYGGTMVQNPFL